MYVRAEKANRRFLVLTILEKFFTKIKENPHFPLQLLTQMQDATVKRGRPLKINTLCTLYCYKYFVYSILLARHRQLR